MNNVLRIIIVCLAVLLVGSNCFAANDAPTYDAAIEKLANYKDRSEVEDAIEGFADIKSDYGNVSLLRMYAEAILDIHDGQYDDAIRILTLLSKESSFSKLLRSYSKDLYLPSCSELTIYAQARQYEEQGDYLAAKTEYEKITGIWDAFSRYLEVDELLGDYQESEYQRANQLYDEGKYEEASQIFLRLGDYKDSEQKYEATLKQLQNAELYSIAQQQMEAGNYWGAAETFNALGDYLDSSERYETAISKAEEQDTAQEMQARYNEGLQKMESGAYSEAAEIFMSLGDYLDSNEQYNRAITLAQDSEEQDDLSIRYSEGIQAIENKDYWRAVEIFRGLGNYSDSTEQLRGILKVLFSAQLGNDDNWLLNYVGECKIVNCNEWVSMRELPDRTSARLYKISRDTVVYPCFDTASAYALCYYDGQFGFIHKQFVSEFEEARVIMTEPAFPKGYTESLLEYVGECEIVNCEEWVSMRESPDPSSTCLKKVQKGAVISKCFNLLGDYALCKYDDRFGFIHKKYLSSFDNVYDLSNYIFATVCVPSDKLLVMQESPYGEFMQIKYKNGDQIMIHKEFNQNGFLMAYSSDKNIYGYVNAQYVSVG